MGSTNGPPVGSLSTDPLSVGQLSSSVSGLSVGTLSAAIAGSHGTGVDAGAHGSDAKSLGMADAEPNASDGPEWKPSNPAKSAVLSIVTFATLALLRQFAM